MGLPLTLAITIVNGNDYKAVDGLALPFPNAAGSWPDLTNAAIVFTCGKLYAQAYGPFPGTVVNPTGASQAVQVELPAADTSQLMPSVGVYDSYNYSVTATLSNGDVITLYQGQLTVLPA